MFTTNRLPALLLAEFPFAGFTFTNVLLPALGIVLALILAHAILAFATNKKRERTEARRLLSVVIYALSLALIALLAVTSFGSIVQFGHMSGYPLLAHVAAAGAFTFLLLALALLYLPWKTESDQLRGNRFWLTRLSAWALVISGIAAAGTMFLSMLPILDTSGLVQVAELHRYAGLLVVIAAVLHVYSLSITRLGWR